jgi:pilus assembly protein CpaB
MNVKAWIPLALAVVLGLIAAKVARDTIVRSRNAGPAQNKTVKIVVAAGPVSPGQELTVEALTLGPISADAPPPGAFTDPAAVVGRVAATEMFPGQPVMDSLLAARGSGSGLQALVPKGMRAVTVEVNETSGVAGLIVPGCRVDVVTTLSGARRDQSVAVTVVQDVLVQAVGQRMTAARNPDEKEPAPVRNVTLIATPREVEAIQLASSMGNTRLVLRGPNDRGLNEESGLTVVDLWRDNAPPPVVPVTPVVELPVATTRPVDPAAQDPFHGEPSRPKRTVALIRGGVRTEVVFDLPENSPGSRGDQAVTSTNESGGQQ